MVIASNRQTGNINKNGEWSSASSLADESPTSSLSTLNFDVSNTGISYGFEKRRPPLNRAIPPIPESKSNESIMSQLSKSLAGTLCESKHPALELVDEAVEDKSVPTNLTNFNNTSNNIASSISNTTSATTSTLLVSKEATSSPSNNFSKNIYLNNMKPNLSVTEKGSKIKEPKTFDAIKKHNRAEAPKSPLLSMAHSVRSRLTMLGTKFGRSDSRSPIRSSTSLTVMPKKKKIHPPKMAKSCSMHTTQSNLSTTISEKSVSSSTSGHANRSGRSDIPMKRSQITLIPSPCSSPRPFYLDSLENASTFKKPATIPEEFSLKNDNFIKKNIQIDSKKTPEKTDVEQEKAQTDGQPKSEVTLTAKFVKQVETIVPSAEFKITIETMTNNAAVTFATSETTTMFSNKDAVYSSTITTTQPLASPNLSKAYSAKTTDEQIPLESIVAPVFLKDSPKNEVKPLIPSTKKASLKKGIPELTKYEKKNSITAAVKKPKKSEDKPKTPKLATKLSMTVASHNNKSPKALKVMSSPKVNLKIGKAVTKQTSVSEELHNTELPRKTPQKSFSSKIKPPKSTEACRNSEMTFINKIERSLIPLIPHHSNSRKHIEGNRNLNFCGMNVKSVNSKNRRAPLAEFESSRVENSPAVELPPIGFDRLTVSPGQRRRAQTIAAFAIARTSSTITPDSNGNLVTVPETVETPYKNLTDYYNFQMEKTPMLAIGFDNPTKLEKNKVMTTVAVQNGALQESTVSRDCSNTNMVETTDQFDKMTIGSEQEEPHTPSTEMIASSDCVLATHGSTPTLNKYAKHSDENANDADSPITPESRQFSNEDIQVIKTKLVVLQDTLVESPEQASKLTLSDSRTKKLLLENERLRRQLVNQDRLIENLRKQLAKVNDKN